MESTSPLDGLLDVCDQLRALQDHVSRGGVPSHELSERTLAQAATAQESVLPALPGVQADPRGAALRGPELLALALLFHRRITLAREGISGDELIGLLTRAGVPRTDAMQMLTRSGVLRLGDWVETCRDSESFDPLDTLFTCSREALELFLPTSGHGELENSADEQDEQSEEREALAAQPFATEEDYLWAMFSWRRACQRRAEALFEVDLTTSRLSPRLQKLRERAHRRYVMLRRRLRRTPESRDFGLVSLAREYRLGADHLLIVSHLLFAEILDGEFMMPPMDCLRLAAGQRDHLFHQRRLLQPNSLLRREGIVVTEGEENQKLMGTPLSLADWVVDRALAGVGQLHFAPQELEEFLDD